MRWREIKSYLTTDAPFLVVLLELNKFCIVGKYNPNLINIGQITYTFHNHEVCELDKKALVSTFLRTKVDLII